MPGAAGGRIVGRLHQLSANPQIPSFQAAWSSGDSMCLPERRAPPGNCSRCQLLRLASVFVWSTSPAGQSGRSSSCSEPEKRQITCTEGAIHTLGLTARRLRATRKLRLGVRQCKARTARTTERESSKDAMQPVLASSKRILALTNRLMFSGLLIRTTPVAIAVVCGAHERISCLAASLPGNTEPRRASVPGDWCRVTAVGCGRRRTEGGKCLRRSETVSES